MAEPYPNLRRGLILYYGGLQTVHFLVLIWAAFVYFTSGHIGVPAPAATVWSTDAQAFLVGTAAIDFLMIPFTWAFVWAMFTRHPREIILETIALTGSFYSAGLFFLGTWPAGAWAAHPLNYGTLALLFFPVAALAILDTWSALRRR
ncbi:MAG: hypothetical protein GXO90_05585 [FCB group bacterium]|nr:hypothetical protein [FCB group bacterium]